MAQVSGLLADYTESAIARGNALALEQAGVGLPKAAVAVPLRSYQGIAGRAKVGSKVSRMNAA